MKNKNKLENGWEYIDFIGEVVVLENKFLFKIFLVFCVVL